MWSFLEKLMPDKASSRSDKADATEQLDNAFSAFEDDMLASVDEKAAKFTSNAADALQADAAYLEKEADNVDPEPAPQSAAMGRQNATRAEIAAPPRSAMDRYRGLAFGSRDGKAANMVPSEPQADMPAGLAAAEPVAAVLSAAMVKSVEFQNQEAKDFAPTMIVTPPDQMIGQAAGLAAQASAQYFDSMTKIIMASQSVMLKKMAENVAAGEIVQAAEDGLVIAETELLLAAAMAVAAAGGAMEAESASFGISKINESVQSRTDRAKK